MTEIASPGAQKANPFDTLLTDSHNETTTIQRYYENHRSQRNAQYRAKLLNDDFSGWQVDAILHKLHDQATNGIKDGEARFQDHRHQLNFYARPPKHICELVAEIQQEIRDVAPSIWFTPPENLHMTTLEIASARTPEDVDRFVSHLQASGVLSDLIDYTFTHPTRLVKPVVSFDDTAMALSFVPSAGEPTSVSRKGNIDDDTYTYHHLRRDLFGRVAATGIVMNPRYIAPSAHITIARFISQEGFQKKGSDGGAVVERERVATLIDKLEQINANIREKYWPQDGTMPVQGEWRVGQEKGLELSTGTSWYGGGQGILFGKAYV